MVKLSQVLRLIPVFFAAIGTSSALEVQRRDNSTCVVPAAPVLNFSSSQWVWTTELSSPNGDAPAGSRAFRKSFLPPQGKTPAYLTIGFAVDDVSFLWVNGVQIVKHTAYFTTGRFCVALESTNCGILLAINVTNTGGPAGLFADVVVTYTDGTTSQIVTDSSWRASVGNIPDGFQELSYDDSTWETVITQGGDGVAPWGRPQHAGTDLQSLATARWIWTNEAAPGSFPPGARAFRFTLILPAGHTTGTANAMITADDSYSIYINGRFIGSGTSGFSTAQRFVADVQGPAVTFAVYAVNGNDQPNPAGLLASIQVTSQDEITCNDCNSTSFVVSSYAWKTFPGPVPDGFEQPTFDDSAWVPSTIIGQNGVTPWGTIAAPTTITTGGTPVPGAPAGSA